MIRVVLPPHLRTLAHSGREVELQVEGPATQRSVLDALEAGYRCLLGTVRDHVTASAGHSCGSSPAGRTCLTARRMLRYRRRSRPARSLFFVVGAIAGGLNLAPARVKAIH